MSFITFVRSKGLILLLLACCFASKKAAAQVKIGDNPTAINPNAVLELESSSKGLLLPRLNLVATDNPAPATAFVQGMFVYNLNTNGTGSTAVTPGIYYSDGTQWIRAGASAPSATFSVLTAEYTAVQGQTDFMAPATITDMNKITVYRNGVSIGSTQLATNMIKLETICVEEDKIKIVQLQ